MPVIISSDEAAYVVSGCGQNIRLDGRECGDFRTVTVDKSILPHVNGSSRVRVGDNVDVICSAKLEVDVPNDDQPKHGRIEISVEVSPTCLINDESTNTEEYESKLASELTNMIKSYSSFPWEQLCIVPGYHCWVLYLDLIIIRMVDDAQLACSIATYIALNTLQIPKTLPKVGHDFDVVGDITEAEHLANMLNLPILLDINKIGKALVVDPSALEMACATSRISFAINREGRLFHSRAGGSGGLTIQDMLLAVDKAQTAASALFAYLQPYCAKAMESELQNEFPYLVIGGDGLKI